MPDTENNDAADATAIAALPAEHDYESDTDLQAAGEFAGAVADQAAHEAAGKVEEAVEAIHTEAEHLAAEVHHGFVAVIHPDHVGCSYGGVNYEPGEDGKVYVPAEAATDLSAHGFVGA